VISNRPSVSITLEEPVSKVYERTEDGTTTTIPMEDALTEVNHAMMGGRRNVREMSSSYGQHAITYKDGRSVRMILVDAPAEPEAPKRTPLGYVVVTVGDRQFAVWPHITRRHPKNEFGVSCTADHTTYHGYRNGERFGPARTTSENSKPGTIGAQIWTQVDTVAHQ
jgi:hypothetical protein